MDDFGAACVLFINGYERLQITYAEKNVHVEFQCWYSNFESIQTS